MAILDLYMQTTGSDLNAGTDNTATPTAIPSVTCVVGSGTITFTAASGAFTGVSVGDWVSLYNSADTVSRFTGQVATNNNTTITILYASGTGYSTTGLGLATGLTTGGAAGAVICRVGGPWASFAVTGTGGCMNGTTPSLSGALTATTGIRVNIKTGSYTTASGTTLPAGLIGSPIAWRGYVSTIGDLDNVAFTLNQTTGAATTSGGSTLPLINGSATITLANFHSFHSLAFYTSTIGLLFGNTAILNVDRCAISRISSTNYIYTTSFAVNAYGCIFFNATADQILRGAGPFNLTGCVLRGGTYAMGTASQAITAINTIFESQSTAGFSTTGTIKLANCTFYGAGTATNAVQYTGTTAAANIESINCIYSSYSGYAFASTNATASARFLNNAIHNISSGLYDSSKIQPDTIYGTQTESSATSPFTSVSTHDFSLISSAASRQTGFPGQFSI